jgi:hypothetical protein
MGLQYLLDLIWDKKKELHIRDGAERLLKALREKQTLTVDEARGIVGGGRAYYKIVNKLKSIGLLKIYRDPETKKLILTTSIDSYKFFVKRYLTEEVEEFFKVKS